MTRTATALAVLVISVACQKAVSGPPKVLAVAPGPGQCLVDMQVTGMDCDIDCPVRIFDALQRVEGVLDVAVDFSRKRAAALALEAACAEAVVSRMPAAIDAEGFRARILKVVHGR